MILSITLNPCVDRTLFLDRINVYDANRVLRCETDAGGKGINAARIIAELDVPVVATGFVGGRTGRYVEGVLVDEKVETDFVRVASETRLNLSVEDGTGMPPTTFNEKGAPASTEDFSELEAVLLKRLPGCRFVTAGGSLPPNINVNVYAQLVSKAREHGVPMAVDAD